MFLLYLDDDFAIPFPAAYACLGQEQTSTMLME